jgi:ATP-dependent RNA helicase DeaD
MIFCNTRTNVDFIANNLRFMGVEAVAIHGGFTQDKRQRMLNSFHSKKVHVLVATDVAARGLHIEGVSHVYNYDIPPNAKEYTHRIGRTARAGKDGKVINLLCSRDYENFSNVMKGDFNIKKEETPYIKRARIRWMPEKKHERLRRRSSMQHERQSRDFQQRRRSGGRSSSDFQKKKFRKGVKRRY